MRGHNMREIDKKCKNVASTACREVYIAHTLETLLIIKSRGFEISSSTGTTLLVLPKMKANLKTYPEQILARNVISYTVFVPEERYNRTREFDRMLTSKIEFNRVIYEEKRSPY
jgi:hypothetical protein